MDRKKTPLVVNEADAFVYPVVLSGLWEISLEEFHNLQRTAKGNAAKYMKELQAACLGKPHSKLLEIANSRLAELTNNQKLCISACEAACNDFNCATRPMSRLDHSLMKFASPRETEEAKRPGSVRLPPECRFPYDDVSMEERYAALFSVTRRIAERRRLELSTVLLQKLIECEANRLICKILPDVNSWPASKSEQVCVNGQSQPSKEAARVANSVGKPSERLESQPVKEASAKVNNENNENATTSTATTRQSARNRTSGSSTSFSSANHSHTRLSGGTTTAAASTKAGAAQSAADSSSTLPGFMRPTISSRISTAQSQVQAQTSGVSAQSRSTASSNTSRNAPIGHSDAAKKPSICSQSRSAFATVSRPTSNVKQPSQPPRRVRQNSESSNMASDASAVNSDGSKPASPSPCLPSESLSESLMATKARELVQQLFFDNYSVSQTSHSVSSQVAPAPAPAPVIENLIQRPATNAVHVENDNDQQLQFVTRLNTEINTVGLLSVAAVANAVVDKENLPIAAAVFAPSMDFEIFHDSMAQDDRKGSSDLAPPSSVQHQQSPPPSHPQPAVTNGDPAAARLGSSVEFATTPRRANLHGIIGYDQSVVETPSRQFMSVSTFMPPLSSTVIQLQMATPGELEDTDDSHVTPAPSNPAGPVRVPAPAEQLDGAHKNGLSPHCVTTPKRAEDDQADQNGLVNSAVNGYGINPIAGGCGIFEEMLKDDDEENDAPRRAHSFRKPRRSSTTFQRRTVPEMSPIVEVSASASASASLSKSRNRSGSSTIADDPQPVGVEDRASRTNNFDDEVSSVTPSYVPMKPNIIGENCRVASEFDYARPLFPKGIELLDANANRVQFSGSGSGQATLHQFDPCSFASQLACLERSRFLHLLLTQPLDYVALQFDSSLPAALTAGSTASTREHSFLVLGSVEYQKVAQIANGAFGNCYKLISRTANKEVCVKLLIASTYGVKSKDGVGDIEQLRMAAIWETYMLRQLAQRSAELERSISRFHSSFAQLDCAVMLRDSAALVLQVENSAALTLSSLIDCARNLRAADAARNSTLPFNEALTHLCTIELCELVLSLVRLNILHTDLRAENLVVTHLNLNLKSCDALRSGQPLLKLVNFDQAVDMKLFGVDSKFGCGSAPSRVRSCPTVIDGCGWSYDLDLYGAARIVQALIHSNNETPTFEKRNGEWRESVPLKRRWNVRMWESFFHDALCYKELTTRDATMAKLSGIIGSLRSTFEQKPAERLTSVASDLKFLQQHAPLAS